MIINDTNKQMIREIIVELFKEVADTNVTDKQVILLEQHMQDIIARKVNKYSVNVYGVHLEEGF